MLTVSHSNASDRSSAASWKESYRANSNNATPTSANSLESEDSDNSSTSSRTGSRQSSGGVQPPIGCITTHGISPASVLEKKVPVDPLQFVKIQQNELCKKAIEQIKLAEEVKITKEKIKETEEEWQNNLLSWKSKRKLTKNNSDDPDMLQPTNRKTKTFTEILEEKARSGARISYNLQKYIGTEDDEANGLFVVNQQQHDDYVGMDSTGEQESSDSLESDIHHHHQAEQHHYHHHHHQHDVEQANLDGLIDSNNDEADERIVFDTTLLQEFAVKQQQAPEDCGKDDQHNCDNYDEESTHQDVAQHSPPSPPQQLSPNSNSQAKINVSIQDWKSSPHHKSESQQKVETGQPQPNSSFEIEEEDEELLDEEMERLRVDQERSFKAKLYAFESLAKQDEEQARKANEAAQRRRRQQQRVTAAGLRSKSCSNVTTGEMVESKKKKQPLSSSYSSGVQVLKQNDEQMAKKLRNLETEDSQQSQCKSMQNLAMSFPDKMKPSTANSTVYNFSNGGKSVARQQTSSRSMSQLHELELETEQQCKSGETEHMNIYENIVPMHGTETTTTPTMHYALPSPDPLAMRNVSHKLLQQQQQIYQNQPLPSGGENDAALLGGMMRGLTIAQDDIGLPTAPTQITKTTQSAGGSSNAGPIMQHEEHLYVNQNQLLINPASAANNSAAGFYDYGANNYESGYPGAHPQYYPHPTLEPNYENKAIMMQRQQQRMAETGVSPPLVGPFMAPTNPTCPPYLLYPKPYTAPTGKQPLAATASLPFPGMIVPGPQQQQQPRIAYNQNHWLLQEAELRRQLESMEVAQRLKQQQQHQPAPALNSAPSGGGGPIGQPNPTANKGGGGGYLSVSGKKKCSSCGEELGKGCAAMVVESLSLYYHINCFRCSVCNLQLGNGTVGTDVRVRNNKLHCQNCYSNDEAGLKFSRV